MAICVSRFGGRSLRELARDVRGWCHTVWYKSTQEPPAKNTGVDLMNIKIATGSMTVTNVNKQQARASKRTLNDPMQYYHGCNPQTPSRLETLNFHPVQNSRSSKCKHQKLPTSTRVQNLVMITPPHFPPEIHENANLNLSFPYFIFAHLWDPNILTDFYVWWLEMRGLT